jgi:hypothetical protein
MQGDLKVELKLYLQTEHMLLILTFCLITSKDGYFLTLPSYSGAADKQQPHTSALL